MIIRWLIALIIAAFGATSAHAQCSTAYSKAAINAQILADFPNQTSGLITPLTMQTFLPNLTASFQQYPGVTQQLGTSYTVALTDYGQLITFTNAAAIAVSLPAGSTTGFCPFAFYAAALSSGNVTLTPQSGTINGGASFVISAGASAMVFSDGTNWRALALGTPGGSGSVNDAPGNSIGYYASTGTMISGLPIANNAVMVTSSSGVPSLSTLLPSGLTIPSPTLTGAVTGPDSGGWTSSGITTLGLNVSGLITFGTLSPTSLGSSPTTVTGLTTNNSPDTSTDYIPYYSAASGSIEKATVGSIGSAGSSGVSNLNGLVGALQIANGGAVNVSAVTNTPTFVGITLQVAVTPPQGRLTLQSGVPVMLTTQANQTTLYYDCFHGGNTVPYWNGSADTLDTIGSCEVSTAMQASSTGVLNTASVFDVWWEGNTHHNICIATNGSGGGWASDIGPGTNRQRGTGYSALDFTTRPYITNKNTISNCYNGATNYGGSLTANKLTYLGTITTSAAGQVTWQFGVQPTSGVATPGIFGVFNAYNQVAVASTVWPGTASWSIGTGPRQINGSAAVQHSYVFGLNENSITADIADVQTVTTSAACQLGIGVDTTSAFTSMASDSFNQASFSITTMATATYSGNPGVGLHTVAGIEADPTASICNGYGSNGTNSAGALRIQLRM